MWKIQNQHERSKELCHDLGKVWLSAVCCSHAFLTEYDIKKLLPLVLQGIKNVPHLLTVQSDDGEFLAFMGIENNKIEMLFVHEKVQKQGIGKELIQHALSAYHIQYVDVNEQNPQARDFYYKMGFRQFARSEYDDLGNHFPLLHLIYKQD